ncbi:hypothetical protein RFI_34733, partial [Reticulomyxa filosa]
KEIPIIKITKDKQKLEKAVKGIENRLIKIIPICINNQDDCNNIYSWILWNIYDVFGRSGAFKLQSKNKIMDNGKQIDDKIRSIISLINICMEHNGPINLINKYIEEYKIRLKEITKKEVQKIINKIRDSYVHKDDRKYYEQIRNIIPNTEITLQDDNGRIVKCDSDKCKLLTEYYKQLFKEDEQKDRWTNEIENRVKRYIINNDNQDINMNTEFEESELQKIIGEMQNNKAVFLDQISNEWIKILMEMTPIITTNLFNLLCKEGTLANKMLCSRMVSLPKKDGVCKKDEVRGIRIKSALLSVIDRLILNRIWPILQKEIYEEQGGFMKGKGTEDNIIILRCMIHYIKYIERKQCILTLIDIRKAFDSVWHAGLLYKIYNTGIRGKIFKLITTILTRSQLYVTAGYYASRPFIMQSGTGQGYSMSGPLFNLYINDMIKEINNTNTKIKAYGEIAPACLFYADDIITISKKWRSNNEKLIVIKEYCKRWKLAINIDKSMIITNTYIKRYRTKRNEMDIKNITNKFTYLGIKFNIQTLSWNDHILSRTNKARDVLIKSILAGVIGGELEMIAQLKYYNSIILPILEYGTRTILVNKMGMKNMEITQHMALTKICGLYRTSYKPMIRVLMGSPPVYARNCVSLLVAWLQKIKRGDLVGKMVKNEYEYIKRNQNFYLTKIMGGCKYPTTYNTDVLRALYENQLQQYWEEPPKYLTTKEWKRILEQIIYKKAYMEDIGLIEKNEHKAQFMEIIKEYNRSMKPYKPLINELETEINKEKIKEVLKIMTGSTKFNWKKKGIKNWERCIYCNEEWEKPVKHIIAECKELEKVRKSIGKKYQKESESKSIEGKFTIKAFIRFCERIVDKGTKF